MRKIELKEKATKALFAVLFFIFSYFLLILSAIGLTILCGYAGILLIALKPAFYTLMIGLGLIGLGGLVLFFLVKFLFKRSTTDRSAMVQIFEKDEPALFAFVRTLAKEIKTKFPKKIYLSSDVNAFVFYDSGFWSMFVPTPKNLCIGLGLVNSVTESELKAILAHEFGHFSQKSMSIGSYVYNVNHVIYNLLNDNESFDSIVEKWANISDYFSIFALGAVKIVKGIQWILVKLYSVVNLSYMELSREMEFEADEIAASVAGSKPLVDSLLRLSFANNAMDGVLNFYGGKIVENQGTRNIYPNHAVAMERLAELYKLPLQNHLPFITEETTNKFNRSQLVIKDQWASHPSTSERVERLNSLGYEVTLQNESAWNYFSNKENLQKRMTDKLFENVQYEKDPEYLELPVFEILYREEERKMSFDERYRGFYDTNKISVFDVEQVASQTVLAEPKSIEDIFNEVGIDLLYRQRGLVSDEEQLEQIASKQVHVTSFDFAGQRYRNQDAKRVVDLVKGQLTEVEEALKEIDKASFSFFYQKAKLRGKEQQLVEKYKAYFLYLEEYKVDEELYNQLAEGVQFTQYTTPFEEIRKGFAFVYSKEKELKSKLAILRTDSSIEGDLDEETKTQLDGYFSQDWTYFSEPNYNQVAIDYLFNALHTFLRIINHKSYMAKRDLLHFQMEMLDESKISILESQEDDSKLES